MLWIRRNLTEVFEYLTYWLIEHLVVVSHITEPFALSFKYVVIVAHES